MSLIENSDNNNKDYKKIKDEPDQEQMTTSSFIPDNENFIIDNKKDEGSYKPIIKIDPKSQRFPYCMVWTPLPCISWVIPCIGHVGICSSEGIIHDFAGPYYVSIDNMSFGNPTKYVILNLDEKEINDYDKAVEIGTKHYKKQFYSFCCNNCHSFVAFVLNKMKYKERTNYTMISIWWMFCTKSKYISCGSFFQTYIGFLIFLIIFIIIFLFTKVLA